MIMRRCEKCGQFFPAWNECGCAVEPKKSVTKIQAISPVTKNDVTENQARGRGRPKTASAMTGAERIRKMRAARKA